MELKVLDSLKSNEKCVFCRHNEIDELHYGKMYKFGEIITHYFCMLFSSNMEQNGKDDQGILGFLPKDIKKEVFRGNKLTCSYCQHTGATIGCSVRSCKKKFHYPCGIQHGSLHLFFGQFRSYCYAHRPSQNIPSNVIKLTEKSICVMCQDEVTAKPMLSTVWASCCKTAWLHRNCVQKMAINAGYFFKCPNCNNKEKFRQEMLESGIYIPDQDAAWELEPNAYHELIERYSRCDAVECVCPKGRNFSEPGNDYEIILCSFCGSQGIHNKCGDNFFDDKGQWTCTSCLSIIKSKSSGDSTSTNTSMLAEDPGPSSGSEKTRNVRQPQNLRKDPCPSSQSEISNSRKRSLSTGSEDESSSCKIPAIELPIYDDDEVIEDEPMHLLNSSGEHIKVVRLENINASSVEIGGVKVTSDNVIVSIDSDDDDDDAAAPQTVIRSTKKVIPNTAPSIFIDLLDDTDDEEEPAPASAPAPVSIPPQPPSSVTNGQQVNDEDDDDDDVIFVGCDPPDVRPSKEDNTTALIRIVDNDRTYIVSPMDIRNSNLELFANNDAGNVTITSLNPVRSSFRVLPNERPTRSFVWQSVPLHKSNANHFPQQPLPQIISAISLGNSIVSNNNADSNYILKENESNSWMMTDASEIINLD